MTNEELVELIQSGENVTDNMEQLYNQNHGMIYKIARRYTWGASLEDLTQEAYIILYKATMHYDRSKGANFCTYMMIWLDGKLKRYVRQTNRIIGLPIYRQEQIYKYNTIKSIYTQKYGREPSRREYANYIGVKLEEVDKIEDIIYSTVKSLDKSIASDDEDSHTLNDIVGKECEELNNALDDAAMAEIWAIAERVLSPKQWEVIEMKYKNKCTIKNMKEKLQSSYQAINDTEYRALLRLKHNEAVQSLAESMGIPI